MCVYIPCKIYLAFFYVLHLNLLTLVRYRIISIELDVREIKLRINKRHHLKRHLGRATIAEGVSKQNSYPFKVMQKTDTHVDFCMVSCTHVY